MNINTFCLVIVRGSLATALVACGGEKGPDDERFRPQDPDEPRQVEPAAPARPGGDVTAVEYDAGGNVARIEDRGANCALPALPGFKALNGEPLLPDPFLSLSGSRITTKQDWTCRRAEISAQVQAYELGPKPSKPEQVSGVLDGDALTVRVGHADSAVEFTAILTPPAAGQGPFPAMIVLGQSTALDANGTISDQGVAMIQFPHEVIAAQAGPQSRGDGLFYELYGTGHPAGALTAWAWGVSRLIDALESTPEADIDTTRLGVTGCSRNGKGALVAGALDERIALTLPQESGAGGSALWRMADVHHREWIEGGRVPDYGDVQTLSHAADENVWFRRSFADFGSSVELLPFDHHMVMGLVAPRALLMVNNTDQYWLDRRGSHFGAVFARALWEALEAPANMGGSQVGSSSHCFDVPALQLEHVAAYVSRFLVGEGTTDTEILYTDGGFEDVTDAWSTWSAPTLE